MVRSYPVEWAIASSIPLLLWTAFFAVCYSLSRKGEYKVRVNTLALSGALLAFVSFLTGWQVIERGSDWASHSAFFLFLVLTYPFALVTPLAGAGQAVMLLWVLEFAQENGASVEPIFGYCIAWVSVVLMAAGVVWPVGLPRDRASPTLYDRLLTLTFRRSSQSWMAARDADAALFSVVFLFFVAVHVVMSGEAGGLALVFVGIFFALVLLRREAGTGVAKPSLQPPHGGIAAGVAVRRGATAWGLYFLLSYAAIVILLSMVVDAFGLGLSGEERTRMIVRSAIALAVIVSAALIARRQAVAPSLPRGLVVSSTSLFSAFIVLASLGWSTVVRIEHLGLSVTSCLVLAGIALSGPTLLYAWSQGETTRGP